MQAVLWTGVLSRLPQTRFGPFDRLVVPTRKASPPCAPVGPDRNSNPLEHERPGGKSARRRGGATRWGRLLEKVVVGPPGFEPGTKGL